MDDTACELDSPVIDMSKPTRRGRWRLLLAGAAWMYVVAVVLLALWMHAYGDRRWLATIFLFGPRWLCSLPLPLLAVAAAIWQRWLLPPLVITGLVIVGPIMGLCVHPDLSNSEFHDLRILTCNVEQDALRPLALAVLVEDEQVDVVALQEVRNPRRFDWPPRWYVVAHDEFLLASRYPIVEREYLSRPRNQFELTAIRYTIELPDRRQVHIFNLHLESPRSGLEAVLDSKTLIDLSQTSRLKAVIEDRAVESARTSQWIAGFAGAKIVMGDFNMPVESALYSRDWSPLANAFSTAGWGFGYTKNTVIRGWSFGTRIDHVLWDGSWRCPRSWVASDLGSDHMPLLADFIFQ
jgi:endonuclease/exonuclease/phosphatase (EEP) superfamily protein YafD